MYVFPLITPQIEPQGPRCLVCSGSGFVVCYFLSTDVHIAPLSPVLRRSYYPSCCVMGSLGLAVSRALFFQLPPSSQSPTPLLALSGLSGSFPLGTYDAQPILNIIKRCDKQKFVFLMLFSFLATVF